MSIERARPKGSIPWYRSSWLTEGDDLQKVEVLRRNITKGLPCGTHDIFKKLEMMAGRILHYRPHGRQMTNLRSHKGLRPL
jgi:hypothetical protein